MRVLSAGCWVLSALLIGAVQARAQDSTVTDTSVRVPPSTQLPAPSTSDSIRRPTTPTGAMLRSFLLPGWGQATYGRKVTGGIMMGVEGLSLGMLLKIDSEMGQVPATDTLRLQAKRQEREDWLAILVFNHLMSGLEAYVSAHLYDFPGDLEMRALPQGGVRFGVTLPLGPR